MENFTKLARLFLVIMSMFMPSSQPQPMSVVDDVSRALQQLSHFINIHGLTSSIGHSNNSQSVLPQSTDPSTQFDSATPTRPPSESVLSNFRSRLNSAIHLFDNTRDNDDFVSEMATVFRQPRRVSQRSVRRRGPRVTCARFSFLGLETPRNSIPSRNRIDFLSFAGLGFREIQLNLTMSHEVFIRNIRELFPLLADTEFTLHYTRRSRNVVPLPEDHQSPQGIRDLLGRTYRGQIVVVPRSEIPLHDAMCRWEALSHTSPSTTLVQPTTFSMEQSNIPLMHVSHRMSTLTVLRRSASSTSLLPSPALSVSRLHQATNIVNTVNIPLMTSTVHRTPQLPLISRESRSVSTNINPSVDHSPSISLISVQYNSVHREHNTDTSNHSMVVSFPQLESGNAMEGDDDDTIPVVTDSDSELIEVDIPSAVRSSTPRLATTDLMSRCVEQLGLLTEERRILVSRSTILQDAITMYAIGDLAHYTLHVTFQGEIGEDVGGLSREFFTTFWRAVAPMYFQGTYSVVPYTTLRPMSQLSSAQTWRAIGSIFSHGFVLLGYIPPLLSDATVSYLLSGRIPSRRLISDSFLNTLSESDRALLTHNNIHLNEGTILRLNTFFSQYNLQQRITNNNINAIIQRASEISVIERPYFAMTCMREGMVQAHPTVWNSVSQEEVNQALSSRQVSSQTFIAALRPDYSEGAYRNNEELIMQWLEQVINTYSSAELGTLLHYISGSDVFTGDIVISFNSYAQEEGWISSNTCNNQLNLSRYIFSYDVLKAIIDNIVNNPLLWQHFDTH